MWWPLVDGAARLIVARPSRRTYKVTGFMLDVAAPNSHEVRAHEAWKGNRSRRALLSQGKRCRQSGIVPRRSSNGSPPERVHACAPSCLVVRHCDAIFLLKKLQKPGMRGR